MTAVFTWSHATVFLKYFTEIIPITETEMISNIIEGHIGCLQESFGFCQFQLHDICKQVLSGFFLE